MSEHLDPYFWSLLARISLLSPAFCGIIDVRLISEPTLLILELRNLND